MATMITRSRRGRLTFLACVVLTSSSAAASCSLPALLERNAEGIGQASQAMRDTTRSIDSTSQTLHALEPSLARVATLGPELEQLSALRSELAEIALLRRELTQIARMGGQLDRVSDLDQKLADLTALEPSLERLIAMREPLEKLSGVAEHTGELARLEQPLIAAAGLEPSLRGLERSVGQLNAIIPPLERTSTSLARLLSMLESSSWLLGIVLLVWLAGTCAAAGLGTFFGLRALRQRGKPGLD